MKVVSLNVNGLRARSQLVAEWLKTARPDILCVQETKVQDNEFPVDAFVDTGYRCVFKGQKSYNGVAIFSKTEAKNVSAGFEDEPKDESRLLKAEIDGIIIVNTYVPQGYLPESDQYVYKLNWFQRLRKFFEKNFKPANPVLWTGDLNVAPEDIDVYDPAGLRGHVCFNPDVTEALKKVLNWGMVDLFRLHCKDAGQYTFWDYRDRGALTRNHGWRLDHIMATKVLAEKCTACYIDKEPRKADRPSDHTPIIAEFSL